MYCFELLINDFQLIDILDVKITRAQMSVKFLINRIRLFDEFEFKFHFLRREENWLVGIHLKFFFFENGFNGNIRFLHFWLESKYKLFTENIDTYTGLSTLFDTENCD